MTAKANGDRPSDRSPRRCPVCSIAMTETRIGFVSVDACASHGMWFDKGEFESASRFVENRGRARSRRDALSARVEGKIEGMLLGVWAFVLPRILPDWNGITLSRARARAAKKKSEAARGRRKSKASDPK